MRREDSEAVSTVMELSEGRPQKLNGIEDCGCVCVNDDRVKWRLRTNVAADPE